MKIEVTLVCEDPSYGIRGHRKFWTAVYEGGTSIFTEWGRIRDGRELSVDRLAKGSSQSTYVTVDDQSKALRFIDKKVAEKRAKGYTVAKHVVDGLNIGLFNPGAATPKGVLQMQTRDGIQK